MRNTSKKGFMMLKYENTKKLQAEKIRKSLYINMLQITSMSLAAYHSASLRCKQKKHRIPIREGAYQNDVLNSHQIRCECNTLKRAIR